MQNFEQVKDVIEYSTTVHDRLRKIYISLHEIERPEREKMLLDYLIEQQMNLEKMLTNFTVASEPSILDSWMQFTPNIDIHELIDQHKPRPDIAFDEIVKLADSSSQALVDFYHEAANESELPNIKKIFENLAEIAIKGNQKQNRAALFEAI